MSRPLDDPEVRIRARSLFRSDDPLTAIVLGGMQSGLGSLSVDDSARPRVVRLSLGCYQAFAGDPALVAARRLTADVSGPIELVYANDPAWRALILEVHAGRVRDRPMECFDPSALDPPRLRAQLARAPAEYELRPLDAGLVAQLDAELEPHALQVYASGASFLAGGFGFGVVVGDRLVACSSTYTLAPGHAEIAIATRAAHRGQGLAELVAARILLHCLEQGIEPHWSASNPVSQRLALRLGYRPGGPCEVLYLE
jgi:GNAT superfamily N-acetyltransferase